jgi:CHAT domain-containing protein
LLGIPLSSLVETNGIYLDEQYTVSYIPSATVYTWLCERETEAIDTVEHRPLLVGNPAFGGEKTSLPWTEEEVQKVSSVVTGATTLLGSAASEQQLYRLVELDSLQCYNMIHFATHAHVDDNRPNRSSLILSKVALPDPLLSVTGGTRFFDGQVTTDEIVREWELTAELVTLSGCQTALGKEHTGEGFIGLANAFFQAGALSLITSLWRVEDESTAMLMQRFYTNLLGGGSNVSEGPRTQRSNKAAALREAKRWLRRYTNQEGQRPFAHPAYWSGFVLSGRP